MYSVNEVLLRIKNVQTKLKFFQYLMARNALDASVGLVYKRGVLEIVYIY